jgi:Polyketide cyclase / dehydrase and lipid transport
MADAFYPHHFEASTDVTAPAQTVFDLLDDHRRVSAHMQSASPMMAGAAMTVETDARRGRAVGARIRLSGRVLGLALQVDEAVTEYEPPRRKVWETVSEPRLLVIGRYRMGFSVEPAGAGCRARLWIDYRWPARGLGHWLGALAAGLYARWCTRQMLAAVRTA